jgi:hypothetical protein
MESFAFFGPCVSVRTLNAKAASLGAYRQKNRKADQEMEETKRRCRHAIALLTVELRVRMGK